jgi:hypothetical protein
LKFAASIPSSITLFASLTQMDGKTTEALLVARLLRNVHVDFLWTMRSEPIDWQAVQRKQIVNRFPRAYFTTKVIYTQIIHNWSYYYYRYYYYYYCDLGKAILIWAMMKEYEET